MYASHLLELRTLLVRFALSAVLALASWLLLRMGVPRRLAALSPGRFDALLVAAYAVLRVGLFCSMFLVLHLSVHGDVLGAYTPEARRVLAGGVPYRDFASSYAPLNAYLDAALLRVHNDPRTLVFFALVCDVASVPFWLGFGRRLLAEPQVRLAGLLYLAQPLLLWHAAVDGKNDALITLLLAVSLYLLARSRDALSGFFAALPIVAVKFLPLMLFPSLFAAARRRVVWLAAAAAPIVLVYGIAAARHLDTLTPLRAEAALETPTDFPYVLGALAGHHLPGRLVDAVTAVLLLAVLAVCLRAAWRFRGDPARLWVLTAGMVAVELTLLAVSKKSYPAYLFFIAFPICLLVVLRGRGRALAVVYAVAVFLLLPAPSFWYFPAQNAGVVQLHAEMLAGSGVAWLMWVQQAALSVCYAVLVWLALREVRRPQAAMATA